MYGGENQKSDTFPRDSSCASAEALPMIGPLCEQGRSSWMCSILRMPVLTPPGPKLCSSVTGTEKLYHKLVPMDMYLEFVRLLHV